MMGGTNLKLFLGLLLVLGLAAVGFGALGDGSLAAQPVRSARADKERDGPDAKKADRDGQDALPAGASLRLGDARFFVEGMNVGNPNLFYSPDGKLIAVVNIDHYLYVFDVKTGKKLSRIGDHGLAPGQNPRQIFYAAFHPDNQSIVTVEREGPLRVWEVSTGKEVQALEGLRYDTAEACAVSPDGKTIITPSTDGMILRWDAATGKELEKLEGHKGGITCAVYSADGKSLASGGEDQTVRLWDPKTSKEIRVFKGNRDKVLNVALSANGKLVASRGADKSIRVWQTDTGKVVGQWAGPNILWGAGQGNAHSISFLPDGKRLSVGSMTGPRVYEVSSGDELRHYKGAADEGALATILAPDGKTVASFPPRGQRVRFWDADSGKEVNKATGHVGGILAATFSPDGKLLATGGRDHTVRLWDAANGKQLHVLKGHTGQVTQLKFSPDGKMLASGCDAITDQTVSLWEVSSGKELGQLHGNVSGVIAMTFTPDGKRLAVIARKGALNVWDVESGKKIGKEEQFKVMFGAAFSPDRKQLAFVASKENHLEVTLRAVSEKGEPRQFTMELEAGLKRLYYTPDSRSIVMEGNKHGLRLWDVASGQPLRWLRKDQERPNLDTREHSFFATQAFSPDGKVFAVPEKRGKISLQELASVKERLALDGGQGAITCVAFSPDGARMLSASEDGTVLVWDVRTAGTAPRGDLADKELQELWKDLGSEDAVKAHKAIRTLIASPKSALPYLRKSLQPTTDVAQKRVNQLIEELGSKQFPVRKKAEEELGKLGLMVKPALRRALEKKPSLDVCQRLEALLTALEDGQMPPDEIRVMRVVEAVEAIGTDEARTLLKDWSGGAAGSMLTEESRSSLTQLGENKN